MSPPHPLLESGPIPRPPLSEVVDRAKRLLWMTDENDTCLPQNQGARTYFDDVRDWNVNAWMDFIHPEDAARALPAFKAARAHHLEYILQYRLIRSDGSIRWLQDTGTPWLTKTGDFGGYSGSITDVSELHHASEIIAGHAEPLRELATLSSDWFWETDKLGRFTFVSEGIRSCSGMGPSDVIGRFSKDILTVRGEHRSTEHRKTVSNKKPFRDVMYVSQWRTDSEPRYLSVTAEPTFADGAFKGYRGVSLDVTEQARADEKIGCLAAENRALIDKSADMIAVFDGAGTITRVNLAAKILLGYTPPEMVGRNYLEFVHPDDFLKTQQISQRIARTSGVAIDFENRWIRKDGGPAYLSWALRWSASRHAIYATARDMSERYHIREALLHSNKQLSGVLESIGDAFFSVDRDWVVTYLNKHCAEFLGIHAHQGVGRTLWEVEPVLLGTVFLENCKEVMCSGKSLQFEDYYASRDVWFAVRASPHDEGLSVFFHDISARRTTQEALVKSEKRFRDLIETTPEGYILADENLVILDVNPAICEILNIAEESIVGQPLQGLFEAARWAAFHNRLSNKGATHSFEAELAFGAGPEVFALISASFEDKVGGKGGLLTAFVTDITARRQTEARLEHLATRDPLTNLPNRLYLNESLKDMIAEAARKGTSLAVMFIDLDRFKEVNDSLGHDAGDILLKEVAVRLRACLRTEDLVARLGGDEFVVVIRINDGTHAATAVVEKIVQSLASQVVLEGHEVYISASIGISILGEDGDTPEALFQNADTAMYKAKGAGRNGYRFFCAEMNQEAMTRFTRETALRHAIERNELSLHYQPRVELRTMQVIGMEALLRWNHPLLGAIPPQEFIPLAEETGLINIIGEWVLKEACRQNKLWITDFGRSLCVSVNLSARQLKDPLLTSRVLEILSATELPANLLELELTETALMEDPETAAKVLKGLKDFGMSLSIDDFGTGHSSLAYLRQFPIDSVKLDRSFLMNTVGGVNPLKLAEAIINLVHTLKLSVVAEGVETQEILDFLKSAQCDEAQGYFLSRPLSALDFEAFMHKNAREHYSQDNEDIEEG